LATDNGENGAPSCANGWLLNEVMRTRWQRPDAVVVTDSGAVLNLQGPPVNASSTAHAAAMAINNGTDMNDGHGFKALATAIAQGLTTEAKVDVALKRALRQLFTAGLFDQVALPGPCPSLHAASLSIILPSLQHS
jgi:beta-glucosidase-like glycosyl hydrolase